MNRQLIAVLMIFSIAPAVAELQPIDDEELAGVDAQGVGAAIEDFIYDASNATVTIDGIGGVDQVDARELVINGGSANTGFSIGSVDNPIRLEVEAISDQTEGLALRLPVSAIPVAGDDLNVSVILQTQIAGRTDTWDLSLRDLNMNDSFVRLWGGDDDSFGDARFNINASALDINTCDNNTVCNTQQRNNANVFFSGINFDLNLGYTDLHPVNFSVTDDGNFSITSPGYNEAIDRAIAENRYNSSNRNFVAGQVYQEVPKSNISIDNTHIGGTRAGNGFSGGRTLGATEMNGVRFHYMQVTSHDL